MNKYRHPAMRQFADQQVRYARPDQKPRQLERAEKLLSEIADGKQYPWQYICFRVTDYRPEIYPDLLLTAEDVRHDLLTFIEELSASQDLPAEAAGEVVLTIEDIARRFSVSTKTVGRWRDRGLVARRFRMDGRQRVGFLEGSVDRFVRAHLGEVERGGKFSYVSSEERDRILDRARRLAAVPSASPTEIFRRIARRFNRSVETVRYTIKRHDDDNPERAIFPDARRPIDDAIRGAMYAAWERGESPSSIAERFQRTRSSVHRIINDVRAERVLAAPIEYMHHPSFDEADADAVILGEKVPLPTGRSTMKPPAGLPPYLQSLYEIPLLNKEQEQHLFRKMNYVFHKAKRIQNEVSHGRVRAAELDLFEKYKAEGAELKRLIVRSNLRLVVSIAKRHAGATGNLFELISDGNISLIRAVEKFDFGRGFKFSTYASWAIMKNFARSIPAENQHRDRFQTGQDLAFEFAADSRSDEIEREIESERTHSAVGKFLDKLDDREREIIVRRYGLDDTGEPQTLEQVGEKLGVTKERIRQIEARAITKLRRFADESKLDPAFA